MTWYEVVFLFLFFSLLGYLCYLLLKEERKRTDLFVKKEIAQRQFYERFLNVLPLWELNLRYYVDLVPEQAHLAELMIKNMEDFENV